MQLICGDAISGLRKLPDCFVHCCVTSPPYYGLRDYGTAEWQGGDPVCEHRPDYGSKGSTLQGGKATQESARLYRDTCKKCGAVRVDRQIGLEDTPEEYVAAMVAVFREVRRVLRDDGTCWINIGDSYAGSRKGRNQDGTIHESALHGKQGTSLGSVTGTIFPNMVPNGCKPKDLVGIPWRVAFALQADGWWLRSDIIWSKPNPMPESVKDRCTKAHEYIFLLSKSARYYYDCEAIREDAKPWNKGWMRAPKCGPNRPKYNTLADDSGNVTVKKYTVIKGANRRTVWTIATRPFKGAHFAVFPPALVRPMILAGTSEKGACPKCGMPWARKVSRMGPTIHSCTLGWRPGCACGGDPIPAVVLDPFMGSGTVGVVAKENGRDFIGIDLNPEYVKMAENRIAATVRQLALSI